MCEIDPLYGGEKHRPPDLVVAELAASQYGVVAKRQDRPDRRRDAALLRAGYRTLRVTALRLEAEPDAVLAEVGVLLTAA